MSPFKHHLSLQVSEDAKKTFEALLEGKYNYAFTKGEIVSGSVVSWDSNYAYIDVGAKTNALLPIKELTDRATAFADELEVGKSYDFYILREENDESQLTLSLKRVQTAYAWKDLTTKMEADEVIEGKVSGVVKGGLLIELDSSLRGFVPSSHMRSRNNLESLVGQTLPFKLLAVDVTRNNIILSHRKVLAEQQQEERKELFSTLETGTVIEGKVVRLTSFGAFVDLGGVDGLLPLSQMSWRWVEHPSDLLNIGDTVKVEVIGVDEDRQRVSLSAKSLMKDPWEEVSELMKEGQEVEGKIMRIKQFGAFVEIHPGVEALLPSRELQGYEETQGQAVEVGMTLKTFIIKFQPEERRISLGFSEASEASLDSLIMEETV
jgi:small subunit ribosomal protein S1